MQMTVSEPIWCEFCEDRPAIGRMILMVNETRIEVAPADVGLPYTRACDLHGRAWTGTRVGKNEETGEVAVLQYVHPDWIQVTEQQLVEFSGEKTCSVCGDPTDPMPLWVAERILKMHPEIVIEEGFRWEGICDECAHLHGCPHCDDEDDDEDH